MTDYTPHQRRIIERYYDNRESIALNRLSELITDISLAETEAQKDRLWKRVAAAMRNLKVPESIAAHILQSRSAEVLAENLKDWMARRPEGDDGRR